MNSIARSLAATLLAAHMAAMAGSPISGAKEGVAIQGYDPVAYFVSDDAVRGTPEHAHEWADTIWFFSSAENKEAFAAQPDKYAPEYGGHCALSVANGKVSRGAGDAWSVRNGKLYLNGSKEVRTRWMQNFVQNIRWGDREWPKLRDRLLAE